MKVIRSIFEMQEAAFAVKRAGRRVALVPTMGALHEGHVALIHKAREQGAAVVVSVYVNPTQFGPKEDFTKYPRDLEVDCQICMREQVDAVFAPSDEEMYPGGLWLAEGSGSIQTAVPTAIRGLQYSTMVEEDVLSKSLEGDRRPGHFRGVCTVVAKLFHVVQPDVAVFGEKDYQQLKVIQRMIRDLCFPIQILPVPTIREKDGLAMSSRNKYLTPGDRAQATVLWKALNIARDMFSQGERNAHRIETIMMRTVELAPAARLDYVQIADPETLEPRSEAKPGDVVLIAARVGKTRLIDNIRL